VVQANGADHRGLGIDDVHRIEPASKTHLEHGELETALAEDPQRRQRVEFKKSQRRPATRRLDGLEGRDDQPVRGLGTIDADALVVTQQVG
jgi:hypothetical protein